jgi:hypothetical protein
METRGEARIDDGVLVRPEGAPMLPPRVSWGAVFAGAVVAVAIGLMLNALGAGVAAAMVDAAERETPSATSFGIGAAIWLLVSNLIGLGVGGYVAARLSGNADDTDGTLHGMAVWATTFLISAILVGNMMAGAAGMATSAASNVVGGVARGAGAAVPALSGAMGMGQGGGSGQDGGGVAAGLVERVQSTLASGGDPATMESEQRLAEIGRLVTRRVTEGALTAPERERLNTLVAAEYGISPEEASARVQQAEQQATQALQQAEEQARRAADAAARGAATTAFAVFGTMLLGALAAVLGARRGTRELVAIRGVRGGVAV